MTHRILQVQFFVNTESPLTLRTETTWNKTKNVSSRYHFGKSFHNVNCNCMYMLVHFLYTGKSNRKFSRKLVNSVKHLKSCWNISFWWIRNLKALQNYYIQAKTCRSVFFNKLSGKDRTTWFAPSRKHWLPKLTPTGNSRQGWKTAHCIFVPKSLLWRHHMSLSLYHWVTSHVVFKNSSLSS